MQMHDALGRIIDAVSVDEATRHDLHTAVNDYFADDIDGLTDEEKSLRRAPVDRLSGTVPALFVGGLTQDQFDQLIEKAADRLVAKRAAAANGNGKTVAAPADTAKIAQGQQPSTTAQASSSAAVPETAPDVAPTDNMTDDEIASFRAWQAANKRPAAQPADVPPGSSGNSV